MAGYGSPVYGRTLGDITKRVRSLLDDYPDQVFQDAFLLPVVNQAQGDVLSALAASGVKEVQFRTQAQFKVPAGTTHITREPNTTPRNIFKYSDTFNRNVAPLLPGDDWQTDQSVTRTTGITDPTGVTGAVSWLFGATAPTYAIKAANAVPVTEGSADNYLSFAVWLKSNATLDSVAVEAAVGYYVPSIVVTLIDGATVPTGSITCVPGAGINDGETVTIDDGVNPATVFEFDSNGVVVPGNVAVPFTALDTAATVGSTLKGTINGVGAGLAIDAAQPVPAAKEFVTLTSTIYGTGGNIPVTTTVLNPAFIVVGMSGATDGIIDGETFTLDGTIFEFDNDGSTTPGNVAVTFLAGDAAATIRNTILALFPVSGLDATAVASGAAGLAVGGVYAWSDTVVDAGFTIAADTGTFTAVGTKDYNLTQTWQRLTAAAGPFAVPSGIGSVRLAARIRFPNTAVALGTLYLYRATLVDRLFDYGDVYSAGVLLADVGPTLPPNLLTPHFLWEGGVNDSLENYLPMIGPQPMPPNLPQSATLRYWDWVDQGIRFPGATSDRGIIMDYWGSIDDFSTPADVTQVLPVRSVFDAIVYRTAAIIAESRGQGGLAQTYGQLTPEGISGAAGFHVTNAINISNKVQQSQPVRRRSYFSPRYPSFK